VGIHAVAVLERDSYLVVIGFSRHASRGPGAIEPGKAKLLPESTDYLTPER